MKWWFLCIITADFQGIANPNTPQTVHKREAKGTLSNLFYEATVSLIPKPHKDSTKQKDFKPVSIMNIGEKILYILLLNLTEEHITNITHYDQIGFIPKMQEGFTKWKSIELNHNIKKLGKMAW